MGTPQRKLNRQIRNHREWLRDSGTEIYEYTNKRIETNLSEGSLPALRTMKSSLRGFGLYYGTKGVIGLVDGLPSAWDDIYLSGSFHLYGLRLEFILWTRLADEPGFTLSIHEAACALCFSLANGLSDWTQLFTEMLSQAAWNDQMVRQVYWQERKFEPFALRLSQLAGNTGENGAASNDSLEIYSDIFSNWNSPDSLGTAMATICDYHCENMEDAGGNDDWNPEFDEPPFDLIPWEILAIHQVRNRLGLATPEINHPLLANVVNFIPRSELPMDMRIRAVEQLREALSMTLKE